MIPGAKQSFILCVAVSSFLTNLRGQSDPPLQEAVTPSHQTQKYRDAILSGVTNLAPPTGGYSSIAVYGPNAFPIVAEQNASNYAALAAASTLGKGRLVALPHYDLLFPEKVEIDGWTRLLFNSIIWASKHPTARLRGTRVAIQGSHPALENLLRSYQMQVIALPDKGWAGQIHGAHVVIAHFSQASDAELKQIHRYVFDGGGLISGHSIPAWLSYEHPGGNPLTEHGGNRLFSLAGIVWSELHWWPPSKPTAAKAAEPWIDLLKIENTLTALDPASRQHLTLSAETMAIVVSTLRNFKSLPEKERRKLLPRFKNSLSLNAAKTPIPTADQPISVQQTDARFAITLEQVYYSSLPIDLLEPHPAAKIFPGAPLDATGKRTKIELDLKQYGWISTGLYAAPGAKVSIGLAENKTNQGFLVQIGCQDVDGWPLNTWLRSPEMVKTFPLLNKTQVVGNPMGGTIYIIAPEKTIGTHLTIEFDNVIEAPYYELGKTSLRDWQQSSRLKPGPWAELASDRLIMSVPSNLIRTLDDPESVMKHWSAAVDACADLRGSPHELKQPFRIIYDPQVCNGSSTAVYMMNSGWRIVGQLNPTAAESLDLGRVKQGLWGHYHELGHGHQIDDWTFDGTREVTCNLFTLYVLDTLTPDCELARNRGFHTTEAKDKREREYVEAGAPFEKWQTDPDLALNMYMQLQHEFGWDAYKRVFREYRNLKPEERPKTDIEKRDQWLVRFSRTVGRNLGPYFDYWGMKTTTQAHQAISNLPVWMPAGRPLR